MKPALLMLFACLLLATGLAACAETGEQLPSLPAVATPNTAAQDI